MHSHFACRTSAFFKLPRNVNKHLKFLLPPRSLLEKKLQGNPVLLASFLTSFAARLFLLPVLYLMYVESRALFCESCDALPGRDRRGAHLCFIGDICMASSGARVVNW